MNRRATSSRALPRLLILLAALLLIAAGCAKDGEGDGGEAAEVVAAALEDDSDDESTESSDPAEDGDGGGATTADQDMFCEAAGEVDANMETIGIGMSPEQLEANIEETRERMQVAIDYAPDDIRPAVETSAEAYGVLSDAIKNADYVMLDVDLSAMNEVDADPRYEQADDELTAYLFDKCGIGTDPALDVAADNADNADGGTDTPLPEGSIRDQLVAELVSTGFTQAESECLSERTDLLETMTSNDLQAITAAFAECGISLERIAQLGGG